MTVIVKFDVPFGATVAGANAFVTCAPVCTLMLAVTAGLVGALGSRQRAGGDRMPIAVDERVGIARDDVDGHRARPVRRDRASRQRDGRRITRGRARCGHPAPQVVAALGVAEMVIAAGSESVNAALVSGMNSDLVSVIVSVDPDPPPCTLVGRNALVR